ncbi:hypothetical protein FV223_02040 [Methylobacterium sp. WL116]|nr:hypothetical protein FV223_02040 [Methylobacterium sp. WL116]
MSPPYTDVSETHVLPDGALWACLSAKHDGGLSHVVLRDGEIEWSEAPGAGLLVWKEDTKSWGRLPAKDCWDAEAEAWVPKAPSTEAVSETLDVEDPEAATSAPSDVSAEPVVPEAALQPSGGIQEFLHATHLATDASWKSLAETLDRTTPGDVRNAVARHVAGGSLSAGNAASLLAILDAAEPPAEVAPEAEDDDYDPVDGSRRPLPPPPGFMEELARKQADVRSRREEAWRPLQALVDAGLARAGQYARDRGYLLPPASDGLMLWYDPNFGCPSNVSLWITDGEPKPEILARVEDILGVTARRGATSIRLLEVDKP